MRAHSSSAQLSLAYQQHRVTVWWSRWNNVLFTCNNVGNTTRSIQYFHFCRDVHLLCKLSIHVTSLATLHGGARTNVGCPHAGTCFLLELELCFSEGHLSAIKSLPPPFIYSSWRRKKQKKSSLKHVWQWRSGMKAVAIQQWRQRGGGCRHQCQHQDCKDLA